MGTGNAMCAARLGSARAKEKEVQSRCFTKKGTRVQKLPVCCAALVLVLLVLLLARRSVVCVALF